MRSHVGKWQCLSFTWLMETELQSNVTGVLAVGEQLSLEAQRKQIWCSGLGDAEKRINLCTGRVYSTMLSLSSSAPTCVKWDDSCLRMPGLNEIVHSEHFINNYYCSHFSFSLLLPRHLPVWPLNFLVTGPINNDHNFFSWIFQGSLFKIQNGSVMSIQVPSMGLSLGLVISAFICGSHKCIWALRDDLKIPVAKCFLMGKAFCSWDGRWGRVMPGSPSSI